MIGKGCLKASEQRPGLLDTLAISEEAQYLTVQI